MHIITQHIHPDEPAYGIIEGPELAPVPDGKNGAQDWRWVQKVFVVRGDTIAKYITDFGPCEDYEMITPLQMLSNGADTVGQLQDYAERNRHDTYWQSRAKEQLESSTLISDLIEQEAKLHEVIRNRTSIGAHVTIQRNGYAHEETIRRFNDRRRKRTGKVAFLT